MSSRLANQTRRGLWHDVKLERCFLGYFSHPVSAGTPVLVETLSDCQKAVILLLLIKKAFRAARLQWGKKVQNLQKSSFFVATSDFVCEGCWSSSCRLRSQLMLCSKGYQLVTSRPH